MELVSLFAFEDGALKLLSGHLGVLLCSVLLGTEKGR